LPAGRQERKALRSIENLEAGLRRNIQLCEGARRGSADRCRMRQ
jgi:hypothetical protein